jgi:peptidoglycan/LPS O-acetylase OafA/YrhL
MTHDHGAAAERAGPLTGHSRPLDGIRACAVVAVLLFHAGVTGVAGGFLGVDAFFVLSGFLITSLLLAERQGHGRIAVGSFWIRRARRLLPGLLVVVVATVVAGHYRLDADALRLLRTDAYATVAYVANWRMIFRGTGYAAATAAPSPLQHAWSLGIEEQFYLVWPLLIVGLTAWLRISRARWVVAGVCAAGAVVSASLCAWLYRGDAIARAYYGTDTRAQALLIGAALAAVLVRAPTARTRAAPALTVAGWAGVVVTAGLWHYGSDQAAWMYRGGLTVTALATAAVIAHTVTSPRSLLGRAMSLPPLAGLGRISYGVYLWHWPLFTFVTAEATGLSRWPLFVVRLAGTLALAVLSYHLVEQPVRRGALGRRLPRRLPTVVTTGAIGLTALAIGVVTVPPPAPGAVADAAPAPVVVPAVPAVPAPSSGRAGTGPVPPVDRPGRPAADGPDPRITFFGDSVSWVISTYLPPHPGLWTSVRAIQGCGIATLPDIRELGSPHTNYPGCTAWERRWQKGVDADNPDVAVIELNRWELMDRKYQGRYQHVGDPAYDAYLTAQLDRAVSIAGSRGAAVVLLTAAYTHRAEKPDGSLYGEDQPARVDAWNSLLRAEAARRPDQVTVLDIDPIVCPAGKFTWSVHGLRIRSDGLHYTPAGVQKVIAPWLLPRLATIATRS